ncbi:RadC family protein [Dyadobacter psychrotolerans]|uniref:DNA repair protein RadC n=1 Tax=Dyadobacter psychrotolerans TaxID=2541721 RepID=A0A4R5DYD6_9BACT|nr:DNA repair protein RadC [Dyadobacter psychrotolerans]TDE16173.1 DNA repair protein RadC [Dyadobacter psychrotolerans]
MAEKKYPENNRKILSWAEADRPREKLLMKGRSALSDAELIAILIGSGTVSLTAVDVAKALMNSAENNIHNLARQSVKDLMKNKGIGEAKAITIIAALELGRRRKDAVPEQRKKITGPRDIYEEMKPYLMDLQHEEFWILLLNRANEVMKPIRISVGGVDGTTADIKVIFKLALENLASSVILVHNHPSGQLKASHQDKILTKNMVEAGRILDIPVLEHLIFTDHAFYSFIDEGDM